MSKKISKNTGPVDQSQMLQDLHNLFFADKKAQPAVSKAQRIESCMASIRIRYATKRNKTA